MTECEVEAGIDLDWDQETKDVSFPGDPRVIRFTVGHAQDLYRTCG